MKGLSEYFPSRYLACKYTYICTEWPILNDRCRLIVKVISPDRAMVMGHAVHISHHNSLAYKLVSDF